MPQTIGSALAKKGKARLTGKAATSGPRACTSAGLPCSVDAGRTACTRLVVRSCTSQDASDHLAGTGQQWKVADISGMFGDPAKPEAAVE